MTVFSTCSPRRKIPAMGRVLVRKIHQCQVQLQPTLLPLKNCQSTINLMILSDLIRDNYLCFQGRAAVEKFIRGKNRFQSVDEKIR